jgi:hypothetical protein
LEGVTAAKTQPVHKQSQQCMQTLFSLTEVTNSEQLQSPFIHRIHSPLFLSNGITTEFQSRQGLNAGSIAAEPVGPQPIS